VSVADYCGPILPRHAIAGQFTARSSPDGQTRVSLSRRACYTMPAKGYVISNID
jgi:hypothetical protein